MGAISFSLDPKLAQTLQKALQCDTFFESGGFEGDTTAVLQHRFKRVISVELAPAYAQMLRERFGGSKSVEIIEGDSAAALERLHPHLRTERVLYWLDAHWCDAAAVDTASPQCPLLQELRAIGTLNDYSAVIIDDARLFLAPPLAPHQVSDWPNWSDISRTIEINSSLTHDVMVVNDCIVVFPRSARADLTEYAQSSGADWLKIADLSREHPTMAAAAEERLRLIQELHRAAALANDSVNASNKQLRIAQIELGEQRLALGALQKSASKSLADARSLTERQYVMQSELEAKEGVIQGLIDASIQVEKRMRSLAAQYEASTADLRAKDSVISDIERQRADLRGQLAAASEQTLQIRAQDLSRRSAAASQVASLEQTVHELRVTVSALEAQAAARADVMAIAAAALAGSESRETVAHEADARTLLSASAKHWQQAAVEKEAVIQELSAAIAALRAARSWLVLPLRLWEKRKPLLRRALKPKLGVLNQHPPIPLGDRRIPLRRPLPLEQLPSISIVTPSFRQAHLIERTIASVVEQQYPKLEYFVQDGGSDDGTDKILERWSDRLSGWESKPDAGQSAALNLAFAKTSGDVMAWLNSDDLLVPGSLQYVANYFHKHPNVDVVYGDRLLIDENDALIGRWVLPGHVDEVLPWVDYVPQETLFWRRSLWEKVGAKIDESYQFAMDWDLLLRFRKVGARFAHLPKYIGAFRIHTTQKTSASISDLGHREMGRLRQQELGRVVTHDEISRAIRPFLIRHILADKIASFR